MDSITTAREKQLASLSAEINEVHREVELSLTIGLENAMTCGQLLLEAKSQCKHGTWLKWLEANFDGSTRTARAYMLIWRRRDRIGGKRQRIANLSFGKALQAVARKEAVKDLAEDAVRKKQAARPVESTIVIGPPEEVKSAEDEFEDLEGQFVLEEEALDEVDQPEPATVAGTTRDMLYNYSATLTPAEVLTMIDAARDTLDEIEGGLGDA